MAGAFPGLVGLMLATVDNALWEGLAKWLILVLILRLFPNQAEFWESRFSRFVFLAFLIGLAYGMGEAVFLGFLTKNPQYAPIFNINTFGLFFNRGFVFERVWAVQIHAILGAIVGVGTFLYKHRRRWFLSVFIFSMAVFYHTLVDGLIVLAGLFTPITRYYPRPSLFLFSLTMIGYVIMVACVYLNKGYSHENE